jgi:DNA invertase Pin-like site-specific DNA recombinase
MDRRTIRQTGIYDTRTELQQGVTRFLSGGMSVKETARQTGVSRGTVSRIKKGDATCTHKEPYVPQASFLNQFWRITH